MPRGFRSVRVVPRLQEQSKFGVLLESLLDDKEISFAGRRRLAIVIEPLCVMLVCPRIQSEGKTPAVRCEKIQDDQRVCLGR